MSSSPFVLFLLPIVVAVGQGSGERRRAGGGGAWVGDCVDDCSGAGDNERERFGDGTGVGTGGSERCRGGEPSREGEGKRGSE